MHIAQLETSVYRIPTDRPEADGTIAWDATTMVLVEAISDAGQRGLGYSYASAAAAGLVHELLEPVVLGCSAHAVRSVWGAMVAAVRNVGRPGVAATAISAVDVALWDLKARVAGQPLFRLLGPRRETVPVYGSGGFTTYTDRELADQLGGWVQQGIPRVKMKIGTDLERAVNRAGLRVVERLARELALARVEIRQGRFERSMALMTAFAAIVSGWEAYAQHLRGAFSHWLMWTPVGLTPPTILAAVGALVSRRAARRVLPALAVVSFADGVVGFVFHLRGIGRMPGGWKLGQYNVVMGPPIFAPLLTCTVGVVGLLAGLLRPEQARPPRWDERLVAALGPFWKTRRRPAGPAGTFAANVAHGRFQRTMALVSASFAILAGGEAYFEHLRGSFNRRLMWTPVWVAPPMVAAGVGAAFSERMATQVLPVTSAVTFLDGLLGFGLHLQGIRRMPGGFRNLQFNFTMGPPLFAPLLLSSVGLLGFIAALLRRADRGRPR